MDQITDTSKYEAPSIEDHGNLTEVTAAGGAPLYFDANYQYEEFKLKPPPSSTP